MVEAENIGKQIQAIRKLRSMTQMQLAENTGINRFQMSYIENGQAIPTGDQLARIKAALQWPANAEEAFEILEGVK